MIGPLVAATIVSVRDGRVRLPVPLFVAAQGVVGCLIGTSFPLTVFAELGRNWPLFALGVVGVIVVASTIGIVLTRAGALPGTTAIWGTSPGASTPMILMSEAYGGDMRLVAVMQQLRITCVIAVAAVVARFWTPANGIPMARQTSIEWFPPLHAGPLALTITLSAGGALLAARLRIPAGPMLIPLIAGILVRETGWLSPELPPWLLAVSYALVGWTIGLRFTRSILSHAYRALPLIIASNVVLIACCALLAGILVIAGGVDPLTAYLATSPGGADSIAIIAASTNVDMRFVMAMQMARFVVVMVVSPPLSRMAARWAARASSQTASARKP